MLHFNVDNNDFDTGLFDKIVDHSKTEEAMSIEKGFAGQNNAPVVTSKSWTIKIKCVDGIPLSQVKNSNPVELAEYALHTGIDKHPAFR